MWFCTAVCRGERGEPRTAMGNRGDVPAPPLALARLRSAASSVRRRGTGEAHLFDHGETVFLAEMAVNPE